MVIQLSGSTKRILCSFGCGKIAKYKFKNGNYCCSKSTNSCSAIIERQQFKSKKSKPLKIENNKFYCSYGCGNYAKYLFKSKNYSCSERPNLCPAVKSKSKFTNKKRCEDPVVRKRLKKISKDYNSLEETKKIRSISMKKQRNDPNSKLNIEMNKALNEFYKNYPDELRLKRSIFFKELRKDPNIFGEDFIRKQKISNKFTK